MPTAKTLNRDLERARIEKTDANGFTLDFHCLRSTAASDLATRTTPAIAQKALRHAKAETTIRGYVTLEDEAVANAIESRPWYGSPEPTAVSATGTDGSCQQLRQQPVARDPSRGGSEGCESARVDSVGGGSIASSADPVNRSGLAVPRDSQGFAEGGEVVGVEGLEPSTPSLSSWCSSQLS